MKTNTTMLVLMAMILAVAAVGFMGCAEEETPVADEVVEPDPPEEVIEEVPEAAEETYTDEPEDPGMEELPPPTEEDVEQEPPVDDTDETDEPAPPDDM
ncbi:MAG: hypothetical protein ACOCX2_12865 [Armatimonadota bacterium]